MKQLILVLAVLPVMACTFAQGGLTDTRSSRFAKLNSVGLQDVQWTKGFWAERFAVCRDSMVPHLWETYTSKEKCFAFQNFRVAAGLDTGRFRGPSFHDGDFYKTLEAVAAMYASTKDPKLGHWMDEAIDVIGKAQKPDGYIYTKSIIEQKKTGKAKMFDDHLSFEAYNFGHLLTAACIHYRSTGSKSLLTIAAKAADFLISFYSAATPEQARNAICPSHYMGLIELYRTTHESKYLALINKLIDIRGTSEGSDDNSDRIPFRQMTGVNGHAVRANYLFAGVADLYAETGDTTLKHTLDLMWDDVVNQKLYVTGGCGALYDGLSLEGISYKPDSIQKIQQAYGKDYELPNKTAHNETCANIGNVLWNWRMFQLSGEARYMDVLELSLYNSVLSGISLDGNKFFYTNPLAADAAYPYDLRWSGGRSTYISKSNCCPPNTVRTIAEVSNYMYSTSENGLYLNMYGGNMLRTTDHKGRPVELNQQSNYPWSGSVKITIEALSPDQQLFLRIPSWSKHSSVTINGKLLNQPVQTGTYFALSRQWKKGDVIELSLDMTPVMLASNPLVEETKNQVAVKRGPLVYCIESTDNPGTKVSSVLIPIDAKFTEQNLQIGTGNMIQLSTIAEVTPVEQWNNTLYREINKNVKKAKVTLIPYYAWANRGASDMTVWIPVSR